jgi:hypothetical protein
MDIPDCTYETTNELTGWIFTTYIGLIKVPTGSAKGICLECPRAQFGHHPRDERLKFILLRLSAIQKEDEIPSNTVIPFCTSMTVEQGTIQAEIGILALANTSDEQLSMALKRTCPCEPKLANNEP